MSERKPDFFVVGAPKCGTTSLASWLADHPRIFMSPVKEPHYFNADSGHRDATTGRLYERLFRAAGPGHIAVGEASVYYLYSSVAVPTIERTIDQPRYIVMLRNPVEMAPALHAQKVFSGSEQILDFGSITSRSTAAANSAKGVGRRNRSPRLTATGSSNSPELMTTAGRTTRLSGAAPGTTR